jgi:pyruvate/2-oxoglutarate dehydrogenase complex dihydrolipoamide acyltransferase (E2) component
MSIPIVIKLQRLSVNDNENVFAEQLIDEGAEVAAGAVIASVENAKAVVEIEAPVAGFVFFLKAAGDRLAVGDRIAVISPVRDFDKSRFLRPTAPSSANALPPNDPVYAKFTAPARELARGKRIDVDYFRDYDVITSRDVEAYLKQEASSLD